MTLLEIVDRQCQVIAIQSEIIKKQAEIIEQSKIADEVFGKLRKKIKDVDDELDLIEYASRRHIGTGVQTSLQ